MRSTDEMAEPVDEVPALEPTGEGRAIDDPPMRPHDVTMTREAIFVSLLSLASIAVLWWQWTSGTGWITLSVLALLTFLCVVASLILLVLALTSRERARLLTTQSWRAGTVRVFAAADNRGTGLLVDEHTEHPLRLGVQACDWTSEQILARTGRLWLVGPSANGKFVLHLPGPYLRLYAEKATEDVAGDTEITVEQSAPTRLPSAAEDMIAVKAADSERSSDLGALLTMTVLLALTLAGLGDALLRPSHQAASIAALVLVTASLALGIPFGVRDWLFSRRVRRLLDSGPWTSVQITMPEPVKSSDESHGQATLSDGRTIPVRVRSKYPLAANIAATGLIWVAGEPVPGRETAVGLPGYPFLGSAYFGS